LNASYYWECNSVTDTVDTINQSKLSACIQQFPVDPVKHGGAIYGERLWMTGIASIALDKTLNSDEFSHRQDPANCLQVRNPSAVNSDWIVVVKITD